MVLASTVILCLWVILRYLEQPSAYRVDYSTGKLAAIAAIVALPIAAKSALGLIPAATFFTILLWDQRRPNHKFVFACLAFLGVIFCVFAPLYLSSPETFWREMGVPIAHFGNFEGWARPWYFFLTNYLPKHYFHKLTAVAYAAFLFSLALGLRNRLQGRPRTIMTVCGGWFLWNLVAVSAISSKAPNFIFQSYLPFLFFCVYGIGQWLETHISRLKRAEIALAKWPKWLKPATLFLAVLTVAGFARLSYKVHQARTAPYAYNSEHEQFYQLAEVQQAGGADTSDLFVLDTSPDDCWFRYYVLFLTGAETRTLNEVLAYDVAASDIQAKYKTMHYVLPVSDSPPEIAAVESISVVNRYQILSFDTHALKPDYTAALQSWIAEAPRSRLHPTTCHWLR